MQKELYPLLNDSTLSVKPVLFYSLT